MDYKISKSYLNGHIHIPTSKSHAHRHLIMAMLSKDNFAIQNIDLCDDLLGTFNVASSLGCDVKIINNTIHLDSRHLFQVQPSLMDVYASGSTLRFMIPICLTQNGTYTFKLRQRLKERSLHIYEKLLTNTTFTRKDDLLTISGELLPGRYCVDGSHSSQFLSGLLMAFPLLNGDSELIVEGDIVSKQYFDMTISTMKKAGIEIIQEGNHYFVRGNQTYNYQNYTIEKDASSNAVISVANYLGHKIETDANVFTYQADSEMDTLLTQIKQCGCIVDVRDYPDLVPVLSLAMALSEGTYQIINATRLKDKESNRLDATASVLNTLGANVQITYDGLIIQGVKELHGGIIDSHDDHRIAMLGVLAGLCASEDVIIKNGECVSKSWPTFYEDMKKLGGVIHEL